MPAKAQFLTVASRFHTDRTGQAGIRRVRIGAGCRPAAQSGGGDDAPAVR